MSKEQRQYPQRWECERRRAENGERTVVKIFRPGAVVEAKHDGASIVPGTLRDVGRLPLNVLCGADLPACSCGGFENAWRDDDILASSDGDSGGGQCGRRRDEGEGREESGEELHCGSM
jgi:hypothetical protein